jgi:CheY-like chemotaxis protein
MASSCFLGVKLGLPMSNIMIVDDDTELRHIFRLILENEGYQVIEAESGRECLKILEEGKKPDLILMDVMMPGLDGWETCKKIKENNDTKDLVVAMLTVKSEDVDKIKSLGYATANWHMSKPLDKAKFVDNVKWLLSSHQAKKKKPKSIIEIE